ncbi:glutathione S-transferase-like [Andrographis paniculata]|uniref:glutathione S-transferase-like n=1 Tax=Andrographis paniculata TaxID=175694 RepID=UPI0021E7B6B1|nr:glutathione S-transferase-like [Andrographis paniculata]
MAIKVHGSRVSTATMRVTAALTEKGLQFELAPVNMAEGHHKQQPFLSLNPFGQVPAFEDGDLVLFESRAINKYISEAYAGVGVPLLSKDPKAMATELVWMEVEAHKYDPIAAKLTFELCIKPFLKLTTDDAVVEEQEGALGKVLDVYEARLEKSPFLGGASFSLADLNHLPTLGYLMGTRAKAVFDSRPRVSAWCETILARPAWQAVFGLKSQAA